MPPPQLRVIKSGAIMIPMQAQILALQLFAVVEELVAAGSGLLPGAAFEAQAKRIIMRLLHDFAGFVKGDPRVTQMILEIVFVVKAGAVGHGAAFGGLHEFELVIFVNKAAEVVFALAQRAAIVILLHAQFGADGAVSVLDFPARGKGDLRRQIHVIVSHIYAFVGVAAHVAVGGREPKSLWICRQPRPQNHA